MYVCMHACLSVCYVCVLCILSKLNACILAGGFGLVYLAKYRKQEVAVKHIDSSGFSDSDLRVKANELR
jgi:hypothetical protein